MLRTCVGCRAEASSEDLVRLVVSPEGEVAPDLAGGAFGRGAWVHPRPECLRDAARGGLSRSLKTSVKISEGELVEALRRAAVRRSLALLAAAVRAKQAVVGAAAFEEAERDGKVKVAVVASDARASAELSAVGRLAARGSVRFFSTKAELGAAFGRDELALVGLLSKSFSRELSRAISLSELAVLPGGGLAHRVTEVG